MAVEVIRRLVLVAALVALPAGAQAQRHEIVHPAAGHDVRLSAPALVVDREGPLVTWVAQEGHDNVVYAARAEGERVRVSPKGLSADSLHQGPGLAVGSRGEIYVSWASRRAKPEGGLFASDLQLSRSLDGGKTFEPPLRVTDDTPTSHSFEGLAVAPDGTVLVAWIETRAGERPRTYLTRILERGTRVESTRALDDDETCVCCRVSLAAAAPDIVTVLWRKVFPGDIRDMVLAASRDGGRTFGAPARVHADGWRITACPHRGGTAAIDGQGRVHAVWYTEGARNEPAVLYATSTDGRRFTAPRRVHVSTSSIPDHARLAVNDRGHAAIVWEDSTAVRRRVLLREVTTDRLGPIQALSQAVKAYAPDVTMAPDGRAVVTWHEEQFPRAKTIILRLGAGSGRTTR
ncbi:MAG: exo-alpha-sialidase [Candidatus Rokubacteria bacterium]|nr:exo-alpha-sialidase [Candidatus Rokubacteria bacterium]